MKRITLLTVIAMLPVVGSVAQSAEEIIRLLEANQTHDTSRVEGRMVIHDRFGRRTTEFIMCARGTDDALLEFTSAEEAGQKVLRTGDEIYLFYPDASELIRLQGAALRQSMLGSDVSYEDMTGNKGYLDTYEVRVTGREEVDGRPCHVLELEATARDVAYPKQKLWVDAELYVMRRAEQYALSGRLLKVMEVQELMRRAGKIFPSHITIRDQLKQNTRTEFIIEEARINIDLPSRIFSVEELTW
ncbi:MAG: outer membrane lipoprotein-sorting protein [Spirochaetes bacterium]|jgi:outer membrane lipoprotein-sorting protein|nr:outer membrane lipoprotein-sorting protein [Spirochaetota bacterium]